jgi:sigma-70-like protein
MALEWERALTLSRLPDHFHRLLVLRGLEGLSYQELSDVMGIPTGTVMSRLSRAREALRRALDSEPPIAPRTKITNPQTYTAAVAVLLLIVAAGACYFPAGRASYADPLIALRAD